ncbi:hypothetical protein B9T35_12485 [Acinetobacter sp. ANC 3832]|nr:hypothetical protein B9T35_12485 [Acinetobacter sp. ANC 3832]
MYHQFETQSAQVEILNQSINKIEITDIGRIRFIKLKKILSFTNCDSEEYAQYDHAGYICTAIINEKISINSIKYAQTHQKYNLKSIIKNNQISIPIIYTISYNENNDDENIGYTVHISEKNLNDYIYKHTA